MRSFRIPAALTRSGLLIPRARILCRFYALPACLVPALPGSLFRKQPADTATSSCMNSEQIRASAVRSAEIQNPKVVSMDAIVVMLSSINLCLLQEVRCVSSTVA